ncbi:hypothetical protein MKX03_008571, partial [Papaver bracteatum]
MAEAIDEKNYWNRCLFCSESGGEEEEYGLPIPPMDEAFLSMINNDDPEIVLDGDFFDGIEDDAAHSSNKTEPRINAGSGKQLKRLIESLKPPTANEEKTKEKKILGRLDCDDMESKLENAKRKLRDGYQKVEE